eukprot:Sspe_Gene.95328::Locus_67632_Transcript_1_1_Confidence_1.000_Length_4743::g.95328::m.95328
MSEDPGPSLLSLFPEKEQVIPVDVLLPDNYTESRRQTTMIAHGFFRKRTQKRVTALDPVQEAPSSPQGNEYVPLPYPLEEEVDLPRLFRLPHPAISWSSYSGPFNGRVFNEAFQQAADTPLCQASDIQSRHHWMHRVANDFASYVIAKAPLVIADMDRPPGERHFVHSPHREGAVLAFDIWFRTAVTKNRVKAFGSAVAAEKIQSLDMQALQAVSAVLGTRLHVPLTCLVWIDGIQIMAECDLGFSSATLKHGSWGDVMPSKEGVARFDEECFLLCQVLAERLGLRSSGNFGEPVSGCHDLQVHQSKIDRRLYIRHLAKLFPRSLATEFRGMLWRKRKKAMAVAEYVEEAIAPRKGRHVLPALRRWVMRTLRLPILLHVKMSDCEFAGLSEVRRVVWSNRDTERTRPEFLWKWSEVPLNSDSCVNAGRPSDSDLRDQELVEAVGGMYITGLRAITKRWLLVGEHTPAGLARHLQSEGVNIRCLGMVAHILQDMGHDDESPMLDIVRVEVASRAFKCVVRSALRPPVTPPPWYRDNLGISPAQCVVIDYLAKLLGSGLTRLDGSDQALWDGPMSQTIRSKFGMMPFQRKDLAHIKKLNDAANLFHPDAPPLPLKHQHNADHAPPYLLDPLLLRKRACELLRVSLHKNNACPVGVGCTFLPCYKVSAPSYLPPMTDCLVREDSGEITRRIADINQKGAQFRKYVASRHLPYDGMMRLLPFYEALAMLRLWSGDSQVLPLYRKIVEMRYAHTDMQPGSNMLQWLESLVVLGKLQKREGLQREAESTLQGVLTAAENFGEHSVVGTEALFALALVTSMAKCERSRSETEVSTIVEIFVLAMKSAATLGMSCLGRIEASLADFLADNGRVVEAENVYCSALKRIAEYESKRHPRFLRVVWNLALLREDTSALACLLPAMQKVFPPHDLALRCVMARYARLVVQQEKYLRASKLYVDWLDSALSMADDRVAPSKWPGGVLGTGYTALHFLSRIGQHIEREDVVALQSTVSARMEAALGRSHSFLIYPLRELSRSYLSLAETEGVPLLKCRYLFRAGECLVRELRMLLDGCEDIALDVAAEVLHLYHGPQELERLRVMLANATATSAKTARSVAGCLKHKVALPLHKYMDESDVFLEFRPADKEKLLYFWEMVNEAEDTQKPTTPDTTWLAERIDTLKCLVKLSSVWGTTTKTRFYGQLLRDATQELDFAAECRVKKANDLLKMSHSRSPPAAADLLSNLSFTTPAGESNDSDEDLRLMLDREGSKTSSKGPPPVSAPKPPKQLFLDQPTPTGDSEPPKDFELAVAPKLALPGAPLQVSWRHADVNTRREFAYLALVAVPCPRMVSRKIVLQQYGGWRAHQGKGCLMDVFTAPCTPGKYCVVYFEGQSIQRPKKSHIAQFVVKEAGDATAASLAAAMKPLTPETRRVEPRTVTQPTPSAAAVKSNLPPLRRPRPGVAKQEKPLGKAHLPHLVNAEVNRLKSNVLVIDLRR